MGPGWWDQGCSQGRVVCTAPCKLELIRAACLQLVLLSEEKQSLAQENVALRQQVGQPEGEGAPGLTAKKLLLLQSQLEQLQEENFRCAQLQRGPWDDVAQPPHGRFLPHPPGWRVAGRMSMCAVLSWSGRSPSCSSGTRS